jgi:GT2 family glycosyltransferase
MSKICIFIPHHKNPKLLPPLFSSLMDQEGDTGHVKIILVDNHCQDKSVKLVRKKFPDVSIFSLDQNEGFAPALNKAVKAQKAEWIIFLNNDVHVQPDWLPNMLQAAKEIKAPCFASHIMDWEGQSTQFGGGWINLFGKGFENPKLESDKPYEIFFACGCGLMIRRDVFMELGGFDDDYFMIYEDVDLGWRLRLQDYPVYMVPDARVMHHAHASLEKEPYARKAEFFERNSLATIYKNFSKHTLQCVLPLALRESLLRAQAVSGIGLPFDYNADGMVMRKAVTDFINNRAYWDAKRERIQRERKVEDEEILERFFPQPCQLWSYTDEHYQRIFHPDIKPHIEHCFHLAEQAVL